MNPPFPPHGSVSQVTGTCVRKACITTWGPATPTLPGTKHFLRRYYFLTQTPYLYLPTGRVGAGVSLEGRRMGMGMGVGDGSAVAERERAGCASGARRNDGMFIVFRVYHSPSPSPSLSAPPLPYHETQ